MASMNLQNMSDTQMIDLVDSIAHKIVVRTYNQYGSVDTERESTEEEFKLIRSVVYGALFTFTRDVKSDVQTIADVAEMTLMKLMETLPQFSTWESEHCNCYLTIYMPLMKAFGIWG